MGRRVRKFISDGAGAAAASTVVFVYDQQGQLLGEYDQAGTAIREYVWLGSTPVAVIVPDPADPTGQANPPLVYYVHADHLDTSRVVVDRDNAVRWRWLAEPFGTTASETDPSSLGAFALNLRFPGQYADQETGLNYNWHRDYDASIGRYAQSDPIGLAGGINTYLYLGASPVLGTDRTGLVGPGGLVVPIVGGGLLYWNMQKQVQCEKFCELTQGDGQVLSCGGDPIQQDVLDTNAARRVLDCKRGCAFGSAMGQLLPKIRP